MMPLQDGKKLCSYDLVSMKRVTTVGSFRNSGRNTACRITLFYCEYSIFVAIKVK
jgi:hypothetical protein